MVVKLIVASGKSAGRSISLKNGRLLIGRAEDCDIRPLGEEVSRRHCAVVAEGGDVTVEDLKSRNGTHVNGVRISTKVTVKDGDIVRVGPLELKVSCAAPAAAVMDDVSRWLMADDEPAGMFDTTQTIKTADAAAAAEASPSDVVPVGAESDDSSGTGPAAATVVTSGIEAILAGRSQPATLPPEARGPRTANSKDAAAEALRKFFGKR